MKAYLLKKERENMDIEKELQDIEDKISQIPGQENKLTMLVISGDLDKHLAAMIIATGAAAMGMKVVIFYTFWGTAALRDPKKKVKGKDFLSTMFGIMLPKGWNRTKLSKLNMAGMGTALMKHLMKKKHVASLDQMYEMAGALGVEINVCQMTMDLMGIKPEEIIDYPNLKICGVATFVANARESAAQLVL
jgi:peroxiredoxin family protein